MRRLQLTFYAPDAEVHPVHTLLAERDYVDLAEMVHWNMVGQTIAHVFYVEGDREAFAAELADVPEVLSCDLTPVDDRGFYAAVRAETTPLLRELFETYREGGVVVTSPLEHTDDGGVTFELVGDDDALQSLNGNAPDDIEFEIERVGGTATTTETAVSALSARQREAVEAALALGYYDVPRTASHEDVAAELDCAPSTASEHLRKAESKVLRALFGT
ncbi:helix-turn-helix domain-containing protein [Halorussus halobius]|uniref:helix-turn-helix domain-containing protein n=1 Tax=Halorussus halobius TaxID=1710537 RepID=UPI001091FEED|nr:helix-turn-helix domain-containing protein [Halorussus halobius]